MRLAFTPKRTLPLPGCCISKQTRACLVPAAFRSITCDFRSPVQVDLLTEINQAPMYQPPSTAQLPLALASEVQEWLATRQPAGGPPLCPGKLRSGWRGL